ncbi:hypothetical protein [Bacillus phage Anath]|uniref:Uncharacterized protein n=1 Tax=Bacillus phage Anath TaxID=2108114 RepID=A0A2P1JUS2_9CAUD|nr:hypothetical protein [Bacillus phage Anath]
MTDLEFCRIGAHMYIDLMGKVRELCKSQGFELYYYPDHEDNTGSSHNHNGKLKVMLYGIYAKPLNLQTVITAMHEIGHLLDSQNFEDNHAYIKQYSMGGTELRAWQHAFSLAVKWGFTLDQMELMYRTAIESAITYFNEDGYDDCDWEHTIVGYTGDRMNWHDFEVQLNSHYCNCVEVLL